ncbi:alginate lyase family protein [Siansivirga zeaxanthinifaciens]|uniref:Alginate lyase domain-containing protein n=1 Tax=Siansivirga zeaxanthinifaciens CC-SAMT-1 TaxID=1454006 RepID=A0A0C5VZJ2_9FLAO|nr:alginate lyase family protein [Siansivirga zeaxanthinifaciens]AJR04486.1 hypothetical protein AW14_13305 [Siansivirga zeaxanthinifaciens CC-SAMT-1]
MILNILKITSLILLVGNVEINSIEKTTTPFQNIAKPYKINDTLKTNLTVYNYSKISKVKEKIHTPQFSGLYKALIKSANKAQREGVFSVVQKTQTPPSGNKHDYLSIGPYWWPDPSKPDGLPWIRRDGEINPLTRKNTTDEAVKSDMFKNTFNLALAYFFSDKQKYAKKCLELLKVWFLNEETKMNPNLNFAQGIPGLNTGRGIGIIEFAGLTNIITAIEILELNGAMDINTSTALRDWFSAYLYWLQTSENGLFEKNTKNNHAVYYDVQVVSILMFLNRIDEAKLVLEEVKDKRITTQIEKDGKQPHELARTKALSYSTMNLKGFTQLAYFGEKLNVDLWNYQAHNGASIQMAFQFLKPYVLEDKKWDYQQIGDFEKAKTSLNNLFTFAGSIFEIPEFCKLSNAKNTSTTSLLYPCEYQ